MRQSYSYVCAFAAAFGSFLLVPQTQAATTLQAGDIWVIGYQGSVNDSFAIVTWVDLEPDTVVSFTDSSYQGGGAWKLELTMGWTPGVAVAAGTVITFQDLNNATIGNMTADIGTATHELTTLTAIVNSKGIGNGDQIFVYQHNDATGGRGFSTVSDVDYFNGTLIYGFNYDQQNGEGWDDHVATKDLGTSESHLPTELVNHNMYTTQFGVAGQYTGPRTGLNSWSAYHEQILDEDNWTYDASGFGVNFDGGDNFAISAMPEPGTALLMLTGLALALSPRRR